MDGANSASPQFMKIYNEAMFTIGTERNKLSIQHNDTRSKVYKFCNFSCLLRQSKIV